ncbi:MAG: hypothetical protein KatS3mg011_1827 [Acidimicrobiia bacterium]|nr:MAG: hypothetical protein KatS3mg011_1827 [Acidimicrobiia bacterium]
MTRTLVLGAAVSGVAAARLAARLGSRVVVYDSNPATAAEALRLGFSAVGGEWDPSLLEGVDLVVTSPGFGERSAPITDALERGVPVISELEFGWRKLGVPTVAVTGTNGKTTVTSMVSAMLRRSGIEAPAVGNIGTPISDLVSRPVDVAVVEASSFQLRFIDRFHPRVAVVTNVAPDHLDWHPSFVAYREAKARIVENQDEHDVAVFDADDPGAVEVASRTRGRRIPASSRRCAAGWSRRRGERGQMGGRRSRPRPAPPDGPDSSGRPGHGGGRRVGGGRVG